MGRTPWRRGRVAPLPAAEAPDGERELLRGPVSRGGSYRLLVSGGIGPKELGKLVRLLELHVELLADEDGDRGDG